MTRLDIGWRSLVGALAGWLAALVCLWAAAWVSDDSVSRDMMGGTALVTLLLTLTMFWPVAFGFALIGHWLAQRRSWARSPLVWALIGMTGASATSFAAMVLLFGGGMNAPAFVGLGAIGGAVTGSVTRRLLRREWPGTGLLPTGMDAHI